MNRSRTSVLWVTEEAPDRAGGGGGLRQANLLIELARHLDVDLLMVGELRDDGVRSAVRTVAEVAVPSGASRPRRALLDLVIGGRPLSVSAAAPAAAALRGEVQRRSASNDLVVVNHATLLPLLASVSGARRIAHPHRVEHVAASQAAAVAPTRRSRAVWRAEARAHVRHERATLRSADALLVCSDDDARLLAPAAPGRPVLVAPNGVDLERFTVSEPPGADRVLFFGSLDFPPNRDGVVWFVEQVWPLVHRRVPTATLHVAGRGAPPEVLALAGHPGVEVVGEVPDAVPVYAAADVVVVPLRIGTGTRLKALEAMAAGRPVVGTTIGLEGLGLDDPDAEPEVAERADDPAALAQAVVRCLEDTDHAHRLAAAGRRHVARRFGWPAIADELASALEGLAARRDAP